jgi:hypothetical protein
MRCKGVAFRRRPTIAENRNYDLTTLRLHDGLLCCDSVAIGRGGGFQAQRAV